MLWAETISAPEEYRAAGEAARLAGMPWCGTMSFDTAGRTMMGLTSRGLVELATTLPHPPLAFGANCGTGAADLLRTVLGFAEAGAPLPVIAKGNAGIPKYVDGHIHYDGTPALMADYAVLARDAGARIIGGCCGTGPEHLRAMREALEARPRGPRPSLEDITAALGGFSSASDGTDGGRRAGQARAAGRRAASEQAELVARPGRAAEKVAAQRRHLAREAEARRGHLEPAPNQPRPTPPAP